MWARICREAANARQIRQSDRRAFEGAGGSIGNGGQRWRSNSRFSSIRETITHSSVVDWPVNLGHLP